MKPLLKTWRSKLPYKTKLKRIKNIARRNKKFESLKPSEQRMEIALDIITSLNDEVIIASDRSEYWSPFLIHIGVNASNPEDLQKKLLNLPKVKDTNDHSGYHGGQQSCRVCARGAMMLSTIRLGNTLDPREGDLPSGNSDNQKYFDYYEFKDMESVFESHFEGYYDSNTDECLANIFLQIIFNNGKEYNPNDLNDYLSILVK